MEYKVFQTKVIEVENERTVAGISAVMGIIDAGGDRLHKGSFSKTIAERANRFRHLWQHDLTLPPIATIKEIREVGRTDLPKDMKDKYPEAKGGLLVKREYLNTDRGNEVLAGIKSDPPAINEMSFGYDPVKFDYEELDDVELKGMLVRNLREVRLWDTSDVNWGMNEATVADVKSALPFRDTGKADDGVDWSKPVLGDFTDEAFEDLSDAEKKRIAAHYTWSANNPPQSFGDLKLPHHQPDKTGVGPAVWKGVAAAMGALMGARGGVDIPAGDRKAVYNHLSKHYTQFDQEPPEYKQVNLIWTIDDLLEQGYDVPGVCEKLEELAELLRAEPQPEIDSQAVLTQKANVIRELQIRQRVLALLGV